MTTRTGIVGYLATCNEATRRRNAHLLAAVQAHKCDGPQVFGSGGKAAVIAQDGARRIRQKSGDGMNKWESQWLAHITPHHEHIHREVSLPLANGLRYKVDFLCVDKLGVIVGYEVKGEHKPTGIAKLKMAARLYPWIKFTLVYKVAGEWEAEEVLA